MEGQLDLEKFETGNYIVQGVLDDESSEFQIGDPIKLNYYNETTGVCETKEYTLLAKVKADYSNTSRSTSGITFYLPAKEYLSIVQDHSIMSYSFNCTDEQEQNFYRYSNKFQGANWKKCNLNQKVNWQKNFLK